MSRRDLENKIYDALWPIVAKEGVQLLDVELTSLGKNSILRAIIYSPEGITLDDCARVDAAISPKLDELDPIPGSYNLEVSSPGLERTLRRDVEYQVFRGRLARVNLFAPHEGSRSYTGTLMGLSTDENGNQKVLLEILSDDGAGKEISFDRSNVSKVQLVFSEKDERNAAKNSSDAERRREKNDK